MLGLYSAPEVFPWVALAVGSLTWQQAEDSARITASGERADLAPYLPLDLA